MIVIDTSAIMSVLLNEQTRKFVLQRTRSQEIVGAASLPFEIGNAVSLAFKRKRIVASQAQEILLRFNEMEIRLVGAHHVNALDLVTKFSIYAYDAYVIEVALRHKEPLLTLDKAMAHIASRLNVKVIEP